MLRNLVGFIGSIAGFAIYVPETLAVEDGKYILGQMVNLMPEEKDMIMISG